MPAQNVSESAGERPLGVLTDPTRELGLESDTAPARTPGGERALRAERERVDAATEAPTGAEQTLHR
jgi:hypothetical protein